MKFGIFLDDERQPQDVTWVEYPDSIAGWVVCSDPYKFIKEASCTSRAIRLFGDNWVISFDHDLAYYDYYHPTIETTGYDCLKWLCKYLDEHPSLPIPEVFFHSKNPIGVDNMKSYWYNWLNSRGGE